MYTAAAAACARHIAAFPTARAKTTQSQQHAHQQLLDEAAADQHLREAELAKVDGPLHSADRDHGVAEPALVAAEVWAAENVIEQVNGDSGGLREVVLVFCRAPAAVVSAPLFTRCTPSSGHTTWMYRSLHKSTVSVCVD
jgi:hypothetical protein